MKRNKQELLDLFGASAIATVSYEAISGYTPRQVTHLVLGNYGRIGNWLVMGVFVLILCLLSSIVSYFWLRHQEFKNAFATTLIGACIGAVGWVVLGFVAYRYVPLDRTITLYASFFSGFLLAWFVCKRFVKHSS